LCIRKTGGNPFFARIFLSSLFEDGLLQLDPMSGAWSWDMEQVRARKLTDNMAELAMDRIAGSGREAQELLSAMAIIGIEGDAALLGEIQDADPYPALRKLASLELVLLVEGDGDVRWQFAHDRIQEAASSRLDHEATLRWHRRIGTALQRRWEGGDTGTSVFSVLRHRNAVAVDRGSWDRRLAEMNLEGGVAAMRATAYDSAQQYFTLGIEFLGPDQWDTDPDTAYELHLGAADAARLALRFDEMRRWLDVIDSSTTDTEQRVKAVVLRLLYLTYAVKSVETVDVARAELATLGWKLPVDPKLPAVIAGLTRTRVMVRRLSIDDLEQLPVMTDTTAQAIVRLLNQSVASAYWSNPKVMALMIQKAVQLSVRHGNDPASALFWASYGMILSGIVGDPEQGIAYADLAVRLADRFGAAAQPGGVRFTRDALVAPATTPLGEIEPSLERAYTIGLEYGEIGFAMAAYFFLGLHRLVSGVPLDTLGPQLDRAVALMRQHAAVRNLDQALALRQFVYDMQVGPAGGMPFTGPHLDGDSHIDSADRMTVAWTYTFRAMSRFHHGDRSGAYDDIVAAEPYLDAMLGQALVPIHHLYGVLAASAAAATTGTAGAQRVARKHRKSLAWWAKHNPVDYATILQLADGALAAAKDRSGDAKQLLSEASSSAEQRGAEWIAALCASVAADLDDRVGDTGGSVRNRDRAVAAYRAWGAAALAGDDVGEEGAQPSDATDAQLDLDTVVRASEAISEEIELGALLRRLLGVTMRNAGAERGVLFRIEDDVIIPEAAGRFVSGEAEIKVFAEGTDFESGAADSVLRLVTRTGEPVISARAVADPVLGADTVIRAREVRSLLCLPLINQGRLQGVLYLENNQVDGAFTPERYRLLRVLSSQAASALEKARLHHAQARLIEAQHRFVPEAFLKTLGRPNLFDVELGQGTILELDILFTDIRGFTTIIEQMPPDQAMEFVNSYLAHMEPVIHEHGGFVADYEGDAILALFDETDSEAAVAAGIAMAAAERADNEQRAAAGSPPVHTGLGINTDAVMLGVVGGASSLRATIVGDAANLASRIEGLTKRYATRMIITENTAKRLRPDSEIALRPLEHVQVVGRTEPALIFEVLDALDPDDRARRLASLEAYQRAHDAYERSDFQEACSRFAAIVAADPGDGPAGVMLRRAEELLTSDGPITGPPITRLESK
jgi:class 3 adenylate cyclase